MIHSIRDMIGSRQAQTRLEYDTGRGTRMTGWVRAVPLPFFSGLLGRIRDAWSVILGRTYAVRWPKAGELERALSGCTCHPDDRPPVPCAQKFALSACQAEVQTYMDIKDRGKPNDGSDQPATAGRDQPEAEQAQSP